jgi:hypothetical protein
MAHTHTPPTHTPICEHEDVTVLWNKGVLIGRNGTANKLDIIIKNKKEKTCILIDVAIPADRSVTQTEAEKKLKHKSLCPAIQRMWNKKCMIIPVVIGATGIVTRLEEKLGVIPGKHLIGLLQNPAAIGISDIIWKVLQSET